MDKVKEMEALQDALTIVKGKWFDSNKGTLVEAKLWRVREYLLVRAQCLAIAMGI
jgi:hypothetical protein